MYDLFILECRTINLSTLKIDYNVNKANKVQPDIDNKLICRMSRN
jgi:hypothetical protein